MEEQVDFIKIMADEYGIKIIRTSKYVYDYQKITGNIIRNINEFTIDDLTKILNKEFSINLFDLFILKKFIEENNIRSIVEFGAGSSSVLIDALGVNRTSFSLENNRPCYNIKFEQCDVFVDYGKIQKFISNNEFDMIVSDGEHSNRFAEVIDQKFLKLINYNKPIFFHDWFNDNETGYKEQLYYVNNILDFYDVEYITDLPEPFISQLKQLNNDIDKNIWNFTVARRCSAILTPNKN